MMLPRRFLPDLSSLQTFECAARHGSFTRAALELNLTQSAVSRQIKELEGRLGFVLFERVRQRALLSLAGQRFLPEVRSILSQAEDSVMRAMAAGRSEGLLSIATVPTFGSLWLAPRLPQFLEAWPGVVVNIASRSARFDFEQEPFDVAVHFGQPVWAGAKCTFFSSETVVPVANRRLAEKAAQVPVSTLPLLHQTTRPGLWSEWFALQGIEEAPAFQGSRFDQFSIMIAATVAGLGIALIPRFMIETHIAGGELVVLGDAFVTGNGAYYVVSPESRNDTELVSSFKTWLIEAARER